MFVLDNIRDRSSPKTIRVWYIESGKRLIHQKHVGFQAQCPRKCNPLLHAAWPGTIKETMVVDEPHPRKPQFVTSDAFNRTRNRLYEALREEVLKAMDEAGVPRERG